MPDTMLVNVVNEEESRIAIVSGGRLEELSIETSSHEQIEGNIYKARVVKVIPSLDAAFVDYGREKNGFLAFPDIHPSYYGEGARGAEGLRNGQELMVQVRKGEIGQKGAALTTYVSIPGRYIVLMPLVNKRGVSRRIQDDEARRELKEVIDSSGLPEGMGYIVRTAGHEQTKQDLARDVSYLLRLWKKIEAQFKGAKTPHLLYQESDIVIRTIRDYFRPSVQEVWVDDQSIYEQVQGFFRAVMPWYQKRVRLYQEKAPLFSKYDLENQIASIHEKTVHLPSGGSIVIEQTEALVSVDVNSGKTRKGKDIEETAFIANQEAATEAARQLRLRDLGGLVVIDFIDMKSAARRNDVRKTLQKVLKEDKARTDIGAISKFGLLELSRQRIKPAGLASATTCPACGGTGKVRSVESFCLAMLRLVHSGLAKRSDMAPRQVRVGLPLDAAIFILNRKRRTLSDLEGHFATSIALFAEPGLQANQYYVEYRAEGAPRVETNLPEDFPRSTLRTPIGLPTAPVRAPRPSAYALSGEVEDDVETEVPEEPAEPGRPEAAQTPAAAEAGELAPDTRKRKRKRRRKKKGPGIDATASGVPQDETAPAAVPPPPGQPEPEAVAEQPAAETSPQAPPPEAGERRLSPSAKRRLRRKRKKSLPPTGSEGTGPEAPALPVAPEAEAAIDVPGPAFESEPTAVADGSATEPRKEAKKGRRPRHRAKKRPEGGPATDQESPSEEERAPAAPPEPEPAPPPAPTSRTEKGPRRIRARKPAKKAAEEA